MSDAGDEIQVDAPVEVEVEAKEAPKGKLSVEEALQVCVYFPTQYIPSSTEVVRQTASAEKCLGARWACARSSRVCQGLGQA